MTAQTVGYREHICIRGDSFDALALRYYNEETLSHYIMRANADYCDTLIFEGGEALQIPILYSAATPETLPPWRRSG